MTPASQDLAGGKLVDINELAQIVIDSKREGLTISGGEPFIQARELYELVSIIRKTNDIGVIIYTGYTIEELNASEDIYIKNLLGVTDLLIDGPYIEDLNDGKNLRGSSNQRVIPLTTRYSKNVDDYGTKNSEIEIFVKEDKILMVGIPEKRMFNRFKKAFEEE